MINEIPKEVSDFVLAYRQFTKPTLKTRFRVALYAVLRWLRKFHFWRKPVVIGTIAAGDFIMGSGINADAQVESISGNTVRLKNRETLTIM